MRRTTPAAWLALLTQLPTAELTPVDNMRQLLEVGPAAGQLVPDRARRLSPYFAQIAVTGQYETGRYGSPSQARAAVVLHAVDAPLGSLDGHCDEICSDSDAGVASIGSRSKRVVSAAVLSRRQWADRGSLV